MKKLLTYSEKIKHLPRSGWLRKGISAPETVAAHSWHMALMALWLQNRYNEVYDFNKVIKLCLCHDLAESIIGDITPSEAAYKNKSVREQTAMKELAQEADFPDAEELFAEYEASQTPEALLAKDLDQLDMYAQSLAYEQKEASRQLEEFRLSASSKIKTELGRRLLAELQNKEESSY